ncbi:MAG TPA: hypothetical protein VGN20_27470 [Mucilaginibacter sp.]
MKRSILKTLKTSYLLSFLTSATLLISFEEIAKSKLSNYSVIIANTYWPNKMHLQVRVGNSSDPDKCNLVWDGYLAKDTQTGPIGYDVFCYYRRDANPNAPDNVHFTNWTRTGCFSNTPCRVDNP